jgi:SAM-dependent methyltransferase
MRESSKAMLRRFEDPKESEFWKTVFSGSGIDVGAGDDLIAVEGARGFDVQDGDANRLADYFEETFDYVHASQCLEHMHDPKAAMEQWLKVLKPNGYLVVTVPSWELYEGMIWPSRYNPDHKITFSMWQKDSPAPHHVKVPEWLEQNFPQHTVCLCRLVDTNYNYKIGTKMDQTYRFEDRVEAFIEFVIQKQKRGGIVSSFLNG